jgi:chromate reductase
MRIMTLCGSLQAMSSNLALLDAAQRAAPADVIATRFDGLRDLPHFNSDLEADGAVPPASVLAWRQALRESDAVLIASPEYGHSLPGALKNAIDWAIFSGELEFKVIAITCAVPIVARGRMGLQALRQTLNAVSAVIVGGEPIARGPNFEADAAALMAALIERAKQPPRAALVTDA